MLKNRRANKLQLVLVCKTCQKTTPTDGLRKVQCLYLCMYLWASCTGRGGQVAAGAPHAKQLHIDNDHECHDQPAEQGGQDVIVQVLIDGDRSRVDQNCADCAHQGLAGVVATTGLHLSQP